MPETELEVEFDEQQEVFLPGSPISGRVLLNTETTYKARAVNIQFEGRAHTNWDDYESVSRVGTDGKTHREQRRVNFSATVAYLEHEILLWKSPDGSNALEPGSYCWPFSFTIPTIVPPSFEGRYGYVRYSVKAQVDRPWRFDKAKKRCITVSPLLDLNLLPHAMAPFRDQASENIGCCCFKKGYLELRVDVPKSGFVPGEVIPFNLHILNHGSVPVTEVKAKINQYCTFYGYRLGRTVTYTSGPLSGTMRNIRKDNKSVVKISQQLRVEPGKEQMMAIELRLPSVTPTINQYCPIITVEYVAEISLDTTSTFNSDVDCQVPILIGTVPIRQYLPPAYYPPNPFYPSSVPSVIPSAPPLSYEDSMYGTDGTELQTDENEKPFVPKYPVFNDLPVYNPTAPPKE
uniref:Arrestin_C domain-containing protein n=1 Tax=Caenorhabditis japonica TaxID=281687 RepID=A0A8R1I5P3_CAEJA